MSSHSLLMILACELGDERFRESETEEGVGKSEVFERSDNINGMFCVIDVIFSTATLSHLVFAPRIVSTVDPELKNPMNENPNPPIGCCIFTIVQNPTCILPTIGDIRRFRWP